MQPTTKALGAIVLSDDLLDKIVKLLGLEGTGVYRVVIDAMIQEPLDVIVYHRGTTDVVELSMDMIRGGFLNHTLTVQHDGNETH